MINVVFVNYSYHDARGPNKFFKDFMIQLKQRANNEIRYIAVFPEAPPGANIVKEFEKYGVEYYNCPIVWFAKLCSNNPEIRKATFEQLFKNTQIMSDILKKVDCHIVISNTSLSWEAVYAADILGIRHIPLIKGVLNSYDFGSNDVNFKILRALEKEMISLSHKVVVHSIFTARLWDIAPNSDKLILIPIGTEFHGKYNPMPLNTNTLKVLTLAAIEKNKNINYIIDIAKILKQMGYNVEFNIYGNTPDITYKKLIEHEISNNALKNYVILHEYTPEIERLYLENHLIFVPSLLESFGMPIIEGGARCRPSISTKCGGPEETIVDGETGFLVEIDNAYGAAKKFEELILNPNMIMQMGEMARKRWETLYTIELNIKALEVLIMDEAAVLREYRQALSDLGGLRGIPAVKTNITCLIVSNLPPENPSIQIGVVNTLNELKRHKDVDYKIVKCEDALKNLDTSDVVVFVRILNKSVLEVLSAAKAKGLKTIYYADDSLFNIPKHANNSQYYNSEEVQNTLKTFIENVDKVVTCSEWLSDAFNKKYSITSTWIDPSVKTANIMPMKKIDNRIVIGYAGNIDHTVSLDKMKELFINLKEKYKDNIQFEFIGAKPSFCEDIEAIYYPPVSYTTYDMLMGRRRWDIGIAYLEDTEFNNNKFINKYLEYSKHMIAGVYSNIPLYQRVIKNKVNGLLSKNNVSSWYTNIENLIKDKNLRDNIALTAYKDIQLNYNPEVKIKILRKNLSQFLL